MPPESVTALSVTLVSVTFVVLLGASGAVWFFFVTVPVTLMEPLPDTSPLTVTLPEPVIVPLLVSVTFFGTVRLAPSGMVTVAPCGMVMSQGSSRSP